MAFRTVPMAEAPGRAALFCTMAKRYAHSFNDNDLVHDTEFGETFVFTDKTDGFRAARNPGKLRKATAAETAAFVKDNPTETFNS